MFGKLASYEKLLSRALSCCGHRDIILPLRSGVSACNIYAGSKAARYKFRPAESRVGILKRYNGVSAASLKNGYSRFTEVRSPAVITLTRCRNGGNGRSKPHAPFELRSFKVVPRDDIKLRIPQRCQKPPPSSRRRAARVSFPRINPN